MFEALLNFQSIGIFLTVVALLKMYFRGTSCSVRRDLKGKVAVVTGGNTGIGRETIKDLAKSGCTIVMGARDKVKSEEAVKEAKSCSGNNNVEYIYLDLGSKSSIEEFSAAVMAKYSTIDILINNAGVMYIPKRTLTRDGFQMQMGINHLGHFYLTYKLWTSLKKSKDLRIINVSSIAHMFSTNMAKVSMDFDDLAYEKSYNPYLAYSRSKLANVLFTKELAKRVQKINPEARVVALHPGVVRTELMRYIATGILQFLYTLIQPIYWIFTKNSKEGAQTTLYCVYEEKSKLKNGAFYSDCKERSVSQEASKVQSPVRLWELSEAVLNIKFQI